MQKATEEIETLSKLKESASDRSVVAQCDDHIASLQVLVTRGIYPLS